MPSKIVLILYISMLFLESIKSFISRSPLRRNVDYSRSSSRVIKELLHTEETSDVPDALPQSFKSAFLQTLLERGFIHQCTNFKSLDEKFMNSTVTAYLGFDATANSLHVGSLLQIMILKHLQNSGHRPLILIGGGTTKVGDPSGKDESRKLLTSDIINQNAEGISKVFKTFLRFGDGPLDAVMVNNADWLDSIKYLEFLRDYGRFFTINRMLSFESVKQRLAREQPLTFLEFNYMLLQAYDFLELNRRYDAILQMGGSDQWGNIISGIELARKVDQVQLFGLTAPLITTSDGKKMGKTASGAVWLNKELLSEYDYWQFWRNTADADVIRFLKLFTEISMDEIRLMEKWEGAELNAAKVVLADSATSALHGPQCLDQIHATIASLFSNSDASNMDALDKYSVADNEKLEAGIPVVDLLIIVGMASSKGEAKRLIKAGGARVNDEKVVDEHATVCKSDFDEHGRLKLSSGKKKNALILC